MTFELAGWPKWGYCLAFLSQLSELFWNNSWNRSWRPRIFWYPPNMTHPQSFSKLSHILTLHVRKPLFDSSLWLAAITLFLAKLFTSPQFYLYASCSVCLHSWAFYFASAGLKDTMDVSYNTCIVCRHHCIFLLSLFNTPKLGEMMSQSYFFFLNVITVSGGQCHAVFSNHKVISWKATVCAPQWLKAKIDTMVLCSTMPYSPTNSLQYQSFVCLTSKPKQRWQS